jgi:hypothetical protein
VGSRAARQLVSSPSVSEVVVCDRTPLQAEAVARALGPTARAEAWQDGVLGGADLVILAGVNPVEAARAALEARVPVVTVTDSVPDTRALLNLDAMARAAGVPLVIGAGMAPGLTCLLARHAAGTFDEVEEVHITKMGTGGPACAHQHHRALRSDGEDWRDGGWVRRRGGSGRELAWFPDPAGGRDCYRAALSDPLLLVPAFPGIQRVTARFAASRRDRLTARLPMLRRPHPEGEVGAIRVEVRGRRGLMQEAEIYGLIDRPAVAAGAVAAVIALRAAEGLLARAGAGGLAELIDQPVPVLAELARRGVKAAVFEGSSA